MSNPVNLDALIPREDFEVVTDASQPNQVDRISISDLEKGKFFYVALRKPDFQRETADWNAKKICEFIQSFLEGDLIPAVILWSSGNSNVFVVDGSHRLSALIAWVNDDYGDKTISRSFFEERIPEEQIEAAEKTRKLVRKTVGTYEEHKLAVTSPEKVKPEVLVRAKRLATLALQLQWVKGDASKAEASFFKINQQAAPIDPTEFKLLKSRRNPNAMAARAIIRSGTGHKYWSKFGAAMQAEIEKTAKAINGSLFIPRLTTPIKTLDLPVAGRGYSSQSLPLIFELVNLANNVVTQKDKVVSPDPDGQATIKFLKSTQEVVDRICGTNPSSLGLHPAVYFYSATGRYQPTAFLAVVEMVKDLEKNGAFSGFIQQRARFETFLLRHKNFVNQVTVKFGSGVKGFVRLNSLYKRILDLLLAGKTEAEIHDDLEGSDDFSFLQPAEKEESTTRKEFDQETKSAAFLRDALAGALKCKICSGLIHVKSISIDHIERKQDGGLGNVANAQLAHPYCNTTVKN